MSHCIDINAHGYLSCDKAQASNLNSNLYNKKWSLRIHIYILMIWMDSMTEPL